MIGSMSAAKRPSKSIRIREWHLVAFIFALAFVLRLAYVFELRNAPFFDYPIGDSKIYCERAMEIVVREARDGSG